MRPIQLQFSGLHSYQDEQTIDFTALGAYGLFGIFGPTGAGKSTILDAITLALYGKIVRAAGNLNGIIHLQCERAHVALEFSLGDTVYVAERLLERDRKDKEKTNTKQCRLYDKTHDRILADKAKQVDGLILDLLGIGMEDFCRAVVLPQGKFQEFLTLTGKDRGEMLENIFGLEKYGDGLTAKILHRKTELDMALAALKGEASAVSGFTEEDKKAMETQLSTLREETKTLEVEKQKAENVYHLCEQLEKNAQELKETQQLLSQLAAEKPQIEQWQTLLEKLQILRSFQHSVTQVEELTAQLEREAATIARQKAVWEQYHRERESLLQQEASLPQWQEEANRLEKISADLEQLVPIMDEITAMTQQNGAQEKEMSAYREQMAQLTQAAEAEKVQIEALKKEAEKIEEKKSQLQGMISQRGYLEQGSELWKNYELEQKNMERVKADCARHSKKINDFYGEIYDWAAALYGESSMAAPIAGEGNSVFTKEQLAVYKTEIHRLAETAGEKLQEAQKQQEEAELAWKHLDSLYLRQQLAADLTPGHPCPVCGSLEHPSAAVAEGCSLESWNRGKEQLALCRQNYTRCLQEQTKIIQQERQFSALAEEQITVYCNAFAAGREDYLAAEQQWQQWKKDFSEKFDAPFAHVWQQLQTADQLWWEATKEQESLLQKVKAREAQLEERREQYRALQGNLEKAAAQREARQAQIGKYEQQVAACSAQWQLPGLNDSQQLAALFTQTRQQAIAQKQQIEAFLQRKKDVEADYQGANNAYQTMTAVQGEKEKNRDLLKENVLGEAAAKGVITEGEDPWQQILQGIQEAAQQDAIEKNINQYREKKTAAEQKQATLKEALIQGNYEEGAYEKAAAQYEEIKTAYTRSLAAEGALTQRYEDCLKTLAKMQRLAAEIKEKEIQLERLTRLQKLCAGKKLIKYLSQEYLVDMAYEASQLLEVLTNHRYRLEVVGKDGFKENFIMVDAYNGGQMRPVKSLSGGETFLVSLALALALSNKIQLKGKYSLDFFFLDEGFGTLDEEKLEVVLSVLEKLPVGNKMVGVITHVPEMKSRLPRFLTVSPATQGKSSQIQMGVN